MPNVDPESEQRTQISFLDVKRAYFNAKVDQNEPPVFVKTHRIPKQHMCAPLLRHAHGTRMAADGWQEECSTMLVEHFVQGGACPNLLYNKKMSDRCSVHGDDFTSVGARNSSDWFKASVAEKYEVSAGPGLGPGRKDAKEGRALNRTAK